MQNDLPPPGGVYNLTLRTLASPNRLRKRSTCKALIIKVSADVENHLKKKCISLPAKLFRHFLKNDSAARFSAGKQFFLTEMVKFRG